jgi:divalent metal cation (Fe/Co/Zn/Cd) transporter
MTTNRDQPLERADPAKTRARLLRWGVILAAATILWNIAEGLIAVFAGARANSVALLGFGIDSFVETASGAVVGWRLLAELYARSSARVEHVERRAAHLAGGLLLALAVYILVDSSRRLAGWGPQPAESVLGIVLTAVSLLVMPLLGWAKLRLAPRLESRALRADAFETITCACLSLTTLTGLALNAGLRWWWADPLAALIMLPLIVREGLEARRGECHCAHEVSR